jgi:hypothetical protein
MNKSLSFAIGKKRDGGKFVIRRWSKDQAAASTFLIWPVLHPLK